MSLRDHLRMVELSTFDLLWYEGMFHSILIAKLFAESFRVDSISIWGKYKYNTWIALYSTLRAHRVTKLLLLLEVLKNYTLKQ